MDDESNLEEDLDKLNEHEKKNNKSGKVDKNEVSPKKRDSGAKGKARPSIKNSWVLFNAEVSNDFMNESDEIVEEEEDAEDHGKKHNKKRHSA